MRRIAKRAGDRKDAENFAEGRRETKRLVETKYKEYVNGLKTSLLDHPKRFGAFVKAKTKNCITSGVPMQRVHFRSFLFIVYINDLTTQVNISTEIALYAGDSKLYKVINSLDDSKTLQIDLNGLNLWAKKWCMHLTLGNAR